MYLPNPSATNRIQCQFLNGVKLVWIQFSFSFTGCHTKVKDPSILYYLHIAEGRTWIRVFLKRIYEKVKIKWLRSRFELDSPSSFADTITVTPNASFLKKYPSLSVEFYYNFTVLKFCTISVCVCVCVCVCVNVSVLPFSFTLRPIEPKI